jgi:hypothetical protein
MVAGAFLLTVLAGLWWNNQNTPRHCSNCGMIICHGCCRTREGDWLCHACGETADRAKSEMVMYTLLKNRSRDMGVARAQRIGLSGRLLPGAGHLAAGRPWGAMARMVPLAAGLFLLLFAWAFEPSAAWRSPGLVLPEETIHPVWFPLPAAAWPGWVSWQVLGGGLIVVGLYLLAFLDGVNLRHRAPGRAKMVASATPGRPVESGPGSVVGGG